LVIKFSFASVAVASVYADAGVPDIFVPIPDVVIYGGLNKLWFHSAETTGIRSIDSEFLKIDELTLLSIISP
jgi:hypothetical protein